MGKYIIAILLFVALLAGLLLYIGETPQLLLSSTGGEAGFKKLLTFEIKSSWQGVIVIATVAIICFACLLSLLGWLWRLPGRLRAGHGLRRNSRAMDAVEDALLAGAEGDISKARKKAAKAQSLIKSTTLGHLISAQTAEAAGDHQEAMTQYEALLKDERTRPTAHRGRIRQLIAMGRGVDVIKYAREDFYNDQPAAWSFDPLFRAYVEQGDWQAATEVLGVASKRNWVDKQIARRRRAVLMTAEAHRQSLRGDASPEILKDLSVSAASDSPDFAPASAIAAKILHAQGDIKAAAKLIEKAWAKAPHPALSLAHRDLFINLPLKERGKYMNQLAKQNPQHRESLILRVEAALEREDYVQAWSLLSPLLGDPPSRRLCALAARTETGLSNDQDARIWLERGLSAPHEADWSDLDPQGGGFNYRKQDWQAMVYSFGEKGELIHPRLEEGAAQLSVIKSAQKKGPSAGASDLSAKDPQTAQTIQGNHEKNQDQATTQDDMPSLSETSLKKSGEKSAIVSDIAKRLDGLLGKSE